MARHQKSESIFLGKVGTNNLKQIDVDIPLGKFTVVTGVSGSGKSSLVFDTLYAEAYRRYVESLSSFARQYMKALPKPVLETVRNLPAAIAVRQSRSGATNRSTVGTMTELSDVLRILFTHLSKIHCTECGQIVERDSGEMIAHKTLAAWARGKPAPMKIMVLAPLSGWDKLATKDLKVQLEAQGFTRMLDGETVVRLDEMKPARIAKSLVVVDRLELTEGTRRRLVDSAQLALKLGRGYCEVRSESGGVLKFSSLLTCCGIDYAEPTLALFSFNHPLGACVTCQGFGYASELDWEKIIPDQKSSLASAGIACWNFGSHVSCYEWAGKSAKAAKLGGIGKKKFADYTESEWQWLKAGKGSPTDFKGIQSYFEWLDSKRYKAHYRIHAARFRRYVICSTCGGARLSQKALACKIMGASFADITHLSVEQFAGWLTQLQVELAESAAARAGQGHQDANGTRGHGKPMERGLLGVEEAYDEATARVGYLLKIGLGYLTLDRASRTLSGGELQRINMARCLGSALTDTLFCLDEPTSGLHARDSANLLEVLLELRDQGNSVVVVEHERTIIDGADHFIEIGPKAGHEGGYLVVAGDAPRVLHARRGGFTSDVSMQVGGVLAEERRFIELTGATTHNLKNVSIKIPVGAITAVCGVSGSGKTSLIQHTLYPLLAAVLGQEVPSTGFTGPAAKGVGPKALIESHGEVALMTQTSLGRSSRSNIATYLGVMDEIRKALSSMPLAKQLGLTPGSFSFNTPGGRCETCRGLGTIVEDLSFLGEMDVVCPSCNGRRFGEDVLSVKYRNLSLIEILQLTVLQARSFFFDRPAAVRALDTVINLGLGYLTLGQSTSSFSGGEAQRLKLVDLLQRTDKGRASLLIFDEPTTGLSDSDVANLLVQFKALAQVGHTVIVVEHHLDVLRHCDWLIEIGPEAAARGGELVYQGPPLGLRAVISSTTRPFLYPTAETLRGRAGPSPGVEIHE